MSTGEITLAKAAQKIGKGWSSTYQLILKGRLGPARQNDSGRWFVTEAGVSQYLTTRND